MTWFLICYCALLNIYAAFLLRDLHRLDRRFRVMNEFYCDESLRREKELVQLWESLHDVGSPTGDAAERD